MDSYTEKNGGAAQTGLSAGGVTRRTMVKGAAWSIPVVAAAAALPVAAASGTVIITPSGLSPAGACGPLGDFTFTVTNSSTSAPVPNQSVVVTLPAGFTWSDGTGGARTFLTDPLGKITVTGVKAASATGNYSILAQVQPSGPSTAIPVTVTGAVAGEHATNGVQRMLPGIPLDSTAIAWNIFLTPSGDLYWYDSSSTPTSYQLIASNVTSAVGQHYTGPYASDPLVEVEIVSFMSGGVARTWQRALNGGVPATATYSSVPSGAVSVGWNTWLAGGSLYYGNTLVASGVTSATAQHEVSSTGVVTDWITYTNASGGHTATSTGGAVTTQHDFPALAGLNATAVGWNTFLTPTGDLYQWTGTAPITKIATGVASASAQHTSAGGSERDMVSYVGTDGVAHWRDGTGAWNSQTVGVGAKVEGWRTFLGPDEKLWLGNQVLATGVQSANGFHEANSGGAEVDWVAWTQKSQCV